ncbi:hypothetical protein BC938DRAFT_473579 [Jimgerdemannia flammicorona]|uniref:Uncharacterized protein n=1 Tax=Jimgerdemannia flammicorona TaxID=994334 RepID=A0A433R0M9_9FUNG|nr:hypothetical protein BC938DRAFT_473579 [Jimgerdemannia flammicorona]
MDPSTTFLSSAFDHLPPLPQPNLDGTIWETFECLRLANQEYAVFQPHPHRRGFFGTFHCAIRPLKKKPSTDRLTKIIFCFCHTLRDHILFIKQANEDRVFFREQTGSDLVVHLASVVATMSAHTPHLPLPQNRTPSILPHERIQRPPDRPSELERRQKFVQSTHSTSSTTNHSRPYSIPESHTPSPLLPSDKTRNTLSPPSIGSSTTSSSSSSTTTIPTFIFMTRPMHSRPPRH